MTGEEAKLEERPLGVGVFAGGSPPPIPPLDLTQGWSQSLCFHFPRGRPQLGGSVAVPLARTLSGQRNQEKGPKELEHGRRIPDRRELEAGPPSVGAGSRPGKVRPRLGEQNQDRSHQPRPRPTKRQRGQAGPCGRAEAWTPDVGWNLLLAGDSSRSSPNCSLAC